MGFINRGKFINICLIYIIVKLRYNYLNQNCVIFTPNYKPVNLNLIVKQLLIMLLCFSVYQIKAQQSSSLKGTLQDTTDFKSVAYAGVMVINPTDSTLIKFTHANDKGAFVLLNSK